MYYVGIDIGSTASKTVVMDAAKNEILARKLMPSVWNSRETAAEILAWLLSLGYTREELRVTATGYGRVSVPYADDILTEITCHGKGACFLGGENHLTVVDIGGQDTKVILVRNGRVVDFVMNDKCSAGTGKFLEIMANRMGVTLPELFALAERGREITISSMCTVFAESEIVSLMGLGTPREDIACGAVKSVVAKVAVQAARKGAAGAYFLTGGFCDSAMILRKLSEALHAPVRTTPDARFAGAVGAALLGK